MIGRLTGKLVAKHGGVEDMVAEDLSLAPPPPRPSKMIGAPGTAQKAAPKPPETKPVGQTAGG